MQKQNDWFWGTYIFRGGLLIKLQKPPCMICKMHSPIQMDKNIIFSNYLSKVAEKNMILSISPSKVADPTVLF